MVPKVPWVQRVPKVYVQKVPEITFREFLKFTFREFLKFTFKALLPSRETGEEPIERKPLGTL